MIRFLIYSFSIVFAFASCATYQYHDAIGMRTANSRELNTFFLDTNKTNVYRANIIAFNRQINGNAIIKTITGEQHRVALVNEFGQTLFDITIFSDDYDVHYAAPEMGKKRILNLVVDIFRTITERKFTNSALIFNDKQRYPVYVIDGSYYKVKENVVDNIIKTNGQKESFQVNFTTAKNSVPTIIEVVHKKYPLTINLTLEEQHN